MQTQLIIAILAVATLAAAIRAAGAFRFYTLVRAYAASALFLGLLVACLGAARHQQELYWLAAIAILIKTVIIPRVIVSAAERTGMSMRLSSSLRPSSTYLMILVIVGIMTAVAVRSPFAAGADPWYLLIVAVVMVVVGFAMMVMRRDLLSQVMGFLVMENGIAAFSFAVIRDLPFLVEVGILMTLTVGIVLMGTVSKRVRELYGTENTQALSELTD
ncbi:MAG TPA: NADH-quinone oxidoreductase subunit K [Candidatus Eisenbacteria bacterium]|jgi:hydrogenase-4 component E|nr:NADH-quinone oxidoreductase subunit K [Candidatus Eisenbacteria bacterium]